MFVPPKFNLLSKRTVEIPFIGTIANNAHLTINSGMITYPFRILCVKMIFIEAANDLVEHRWFVGSNQTTSVTGPPSDINIFGQESPSAFFVGQGIIRVVNTNLEFKGGMAYIKLYTHNTSGATYTINCSIVIQEI